jgi:hypothetical protein
MVRNPTAGELDEGVVSYDRCAGFIGDDFTVERDDAVMLGGDVAGIAEIAVRKLDAGLAAGGFDRAALVIGHIATEQDLAALKRRNRAAVLIVETAAIVAFDIDA